jgi:hypothetical protein
VIPRVRLLVATAFLWPTALSAQVLLDSTDNLDFDRPEAWAMQYFSSVNLMTGFGPPQALPAGAVVVGLEVDWIPSLSEAEQRVGFNGTKSEDLDRTSVFGRPRVAVGLPGQFALEASYLPPIDISGVEPDLVALALSRRLPTTRKIDSGLRLTLQRGSFSGDFTCSAREIESGPNEFGCEVPSDDEMTLETASLELSVARRGAGESSLTPYASLAVTAMDLEFQVRADYSGLMDRTRLVASGTTYSMSLGVGRRFGDGWRWAGEVFYSPLDAARPAGTPPTDDSLLNARMLLTYRAR